VAGASQTDADANLIEYAEHDWHLLKFVPAVRQCQQIFVQGEGMLLTSPAIAVHKGRNHYRINALHKAYKLIFRSSNNPTNTKELEALSKDFKEVSKLLNFIEKSERGVIQSSKQDD